MAIFAYSTKYNKNTNANYCILVESHNGTCDPFFAHKKAEAIAFAEKMINSILTIRVAVWQGFYRVRGGHVIGKDYLIWMEENPPEIWD